MAAEEIREVVAKLHFADRGHLFAFESKHFGLLQATAGNGSARGSGLPSRAKNSTLSGLRLSA